MRTLPRCWSCAGRRQSSVAAADQELLDHQAQLRMRRTEWKRRQKGNSFLDFLVVHVRAGKGGNGCVAFNREKYKPFGPPSGGNGGRGGDVYFLPTSELSSLSSVPRSIRGEDGVTGQGTWQHGKNGSPLIIKVPLGTVVRQLHRDDPRRIKDEWEEEQETLAGLPEDELWTKIRQRRFVHYPRYSEENEKRDVFKEAEHEVLRQDRHRRIAWRRREADQPLRLDLDAEAIPPEQDPNAPLAGHRDDFKGYLIASGGAGGLGNPYFQSTDFRSPKFATCGLEGERLTLSLELKLLADVGMVGMPNAGKSTLLRALTGGRAKTEVAPYPFTTLNPIIGVVRVGQEGIFEGGISSQSIHDETSAEDRRELEAMQKGQYAFSLSRNQRSPTEHGLAAGHRFDVLETFRFTIADNPGLISGSSQNIGLGHSFLRAVERSLALIYVIDFSQAEPWNELKVLQEELEQYRSGLSYKARLVIANKADLLAEDGKPETVSAAQSKLFQLQQFVQTNLNSSMDVIPVSAKYSQNLTKLVTLLQQHVQTARLAQRSEQRIIASQIDD